MREIDEYAFDQEFDLVPVPEEAENNAGSDIWEMDQIQDLLPGVEAQHIWSWMDGEDGGDFLVAGVHHVNVYGFAVTKQTHDFDTTVEMDRGWVEVEPDYDEDDDT